MRTYLVTTVSMAILSGMLGFVVAEAAPSVVEVPSIHEHAAQAPKPSPDVLCMGAENDLSLSLAPVRSIESSSGAEQIQLELSIGNRIPLEARVAYSIELVNDLGDAIQAPVLPPVRSIQAAKVLSAEKILLPAKLADGFYLLRVQAVSRSEDGAGAAEHADFRFQVENGAMTELDHDTWVRRSRANLSQEAVP